MADDFDPYYLWLGIPPNERPINHYKLLGVSLFEKNPQVIESAADRATTHLQSLQAGKHSALCQRLLGQVAAARVCLLQANQKAKYDQALRLKLDAQAIASRSSSPEKPRVVASAQPAAPAQAQPSVRNDSSATGSESFWDDLGASGAAQTSAKPLKPQALAAKPNPLKKLWPVFLGAGACLLLAAVVMAINVMNEPSKEQASVSPTHDSMQPLRSKPKESMLVFDWPADDRAGLALTVDGAKVAVPVVGPWEFHCVNGRHRLIATRPGFKPIDKTVEVPADGRVRIADAWQPAATIALDWPVNDRDGAVLKVDGQVLVAGAEQPFVLPIDAGEHTVRITRPGFVPFEKNVMVSNDHRFDVAVAFESMVAKAASLVINWPLADRGGARLLIDGQLRHEPVESNTERIPFDLPPGTHTILIQRVGFKPFFKSLTIAATSHEMVSPTWVSDAEATADTAEHSDIRIDGQSSESKTPTVAAESREKHSVPLAADQQRVGKQLDQIYKSVHDPAKDLAQAKQLFDLASEAKDLTERYMLLLRGADLAVDGGDFSLALQGIDSLDSQFIVSTLEIKEKLLENFVPVPSSLDQLSDAVSNSLRLIDDAIAADRFDVATALVKAIARLIEKKSVDPELRRITEKTLATYRTQIKTFEPQFALAQKAKLTLETHPEDADANETLGKWDCFFKGDWKKGMPYFVKSGNDKLKPVAEAELMSSSDNAQKLKVADQWWEIAQKETGLAADSIHLHAGDLYRSALPSITSVLQKAAVEKKLAEVTEIRSRLSDSASGQHSGPVVFQRGRWYDVLKFVDVDRDAVAGSWTLQGENLVCTTPRGSCARLELPLAINGGYDLEVHVSRPKNLGNSYHTIFPVGKQIVGFTLGASNYCGLDSVNGTTLESLTFYQFPYAVRNFDLQAEHSYQEVFNVRLGKGGAASVNVWLDGKRFISHWEGDPSTLGVGTRFLQPPKRPALQTDYSGSLTFQMVRLRMVSGQGHVELPSADQRPGQSAEPGVKNPPVNTPMKLPRPK